jgi:hypothetical protein
VGNGARPGRNGTPEQEESMAYRLCCSAVALALVVVAGAAQERERERERAGDHPHLRAALHELREARHALQEAKDSWPPGYKERAMASTQNAINSIKTILQVKDVDSFRGVDRNQEYYRRYQDHPHLRAAIQDLREAREELRTARADAGNLKEEALDYIDMAIGDIVTLIKHDRR